MDLTKSKLAIILSKLANNEKQNIGLEQYELPSERAADLLWGVYMNNELKGKCVADLGSGTGMLGLGALLLGASKVYFVEISESSMEICKKNLLKQSKKADQETTTYKIQLLKKNKWKSKWNNKTKLYEKRK